MTTKLFAAALAALMTAAFAAPAAAKPTTTNASKSNSQERAFAIDPADAGGAGKCTAGKGVVATAANGTKYCIGGTSTPPTGAAVTTVQSSKSNSSSYKVNFDAACAAENGVVATDASAKKYCLKAAAAPAAPAK